MNTAKGETAGGCALKPGTIDEIRILLANARASAFEERDLEDQIRCALAATLTDENAGQIAASLSAAEARTEFGVAVLERWATADPNAAAQWLAGQAQPTDEQLYALAKATARDEATLNRIQAQLPAGPVRDLFLAHAVRMAVLEDPSSAARLAQSISSRGERTKALLVVADEWARRDPEATARWIDGQAETGCRDELVRSAALAQASVSPIGALEWTLTAGASDAGCDRAIRAIVASWTDFAPTAARRFIASVDALSPPGSISTTKP